MKLKFYTATGLVVLFSFAANPSYSQSTDTHPKSPYAGQETWKIKSLSQKDIDDLSNGRGWGFAKAAELNGLPGPIHILELADRINLSPEQRRKIEGLFKEMKSLAVPLGEEMVRLERGLDRLFRNKTANETNLKSQLTNIGKVRSELRRVHLQAHLRSPDILTAHQIAIYNRLRGYTDINKHSGHTGRHHKM